MLAKNVNAHAGCLVQRGDCAFFASKLAPTVLALPLLLILRERHTDALWKMDTHRHSAGRLKLLAGRLRQRFTDFHPGNPG
ncbi:hypothetical protein C7A12_12370 [Pseudomonas fluorescens]|uniref:Uncharacterized protein n=1 Tax=Pseudomonas fluorescens TaxID=294 RepID=A0A2T0IEC2_PSEFL|nr:hypothetical protein C7A12_12370 [Pseudomonas fluorescens]PRW79107.1 hypothetical protein C7A13_11430 [Pseudomonas fluorescens]PRW93675.1 hypothetical protein C7A10_06970 [Pseudomonas fluorescens]